MLRPLNKSVEKNFHLNYGRDIIAGWCNEHAGRQDGMKLKVLDIGCGYGADLQNVKSSIADKDLELYGIDYDEQKAEALRHNGINVRVLDIEKDALPFEDGFFDIIIANQVIEHTKEVFWIFSEVSRTLKKGGILIIGVPNLASLHNRVLLLLGEQPTSIETMGPHVRGYTVPSLKRFIETDGYFRVSKVRGSNFYPFPPPVSSVLSKIFPRFAASSFLLVERLGKSGKFISVFDAREFETPYYKGNQ
ncbi:class I SAM-dependent methyltransferase [Methanooceanicella nereidis]|nr:class I SAM-dependent methyltransferase [Methanocella sp. CWC-04]